MNTSTDTGAYLQGSACGIVAVSIWAVCMPVTRLSVTTTLTPFDLVFLRFTVAGLILLPALLAAMPRLKRVEWWQLTLIVLGAGAPYSLVAGTGLRLAPAAHAGALTPGVMPMLAALLAAAFLGEKITMRRAAGYCLITCGVVAVAGFGLLAGVSLQSIGHALFLVAALM